MVDGGLSDDTERRAAWSRLWAQGGAGSFLDATADGNLPLRDHWQAWFATLPAGAHVLDIATGNGILPRWLIAAHPSATCDAIDLAAIQPGWQHERVRFHGGVAAEQLPWREPRFDAIVSQFGVEYGNLEVSLTQISQVARPGTKLHFVMHHEESLPAQLAADEIAHIDWLLEASGWLDAAIGMLEPMSLLDDQQSQHRLRSDPALHHIRHTYDQATDALHQRINKSSCPDILIDAHNQVAQIFGATSHGGLEHGQKLFVNLRQWLLDSRSRLIDMQQHAKSKSTLESIVSFLAELGWSTTKFSLCHERHDRLMGWQVYATYT